MYLNGKDTEIIWNRILENKVLKDGLKASKGKPHKVFEIMQHAYYWNIRLCANRCLEGWCENTFSDLGDEHTIKLLTKTMEQVVCLMSCLAGVTPNEFKTMFPIKKDFKQRGCLNYWSTMEMLKDFPLDEHIGDGNVTRFLIEYCNDYVEDFILYYMEIVDLVRALDGLPSVISDILKLNIKPRLFSIVEILNDIDNIEN